MDKENIDPKPGSHCKDVANRKEYKCGPNSIFKDALSTPGLDLSQMSPGAILSLKRPPPSDSESDDEDDESARVRKALKLEREQKDPSFDPWDKRYAKVRYTSSGKPIVRATKPYNVWAANHYGYLRHQNPVYKKSKGDNGFNNGDNQVDEEDEIGLKTIAFPAVVEDIKKGLLKEMQLNGNFSKSVNEVFREKYYIEIPYCRWCDTRPCACFVN